MRQCASVSHYRIACDEIIDCLQYKFSLVEFFFSFGVFGIVTDLFQRGTLKLFFVFTKIINNHKIIEVQCINPSHMGLMPNVHLENFYCICR